MARTWQFWIDRGGTFTDVIGRDPQGKLHALKLLSADPARYADAALEGIRRLAGEGAEIEAVKMGTTVGTNALLERAGEPTVLAINEGLRDQVRIGHQARPSLFARRIERPHPFYDEVIEVPVRVLADGRTHRPLDEGLLRSRLQEAHHKGFRALAIALMHADRFPDQERAIAAIAREIGFEQVTLSSEASPLLKLVPRAETAVVDATLSPILAKYVNSVRAGLPRTPLFFMQSSGGLAEAERFGGKDSVLSGPAGGVVGAVASAREAGYERVVGFDMGGTSTDVCHFAGEWERSLESEVAGARVRVPVLNVHTVAAGGGSICRFEGGRLLVGPQSAGAQPGPACYGNGGPLTITDCNVALGRLRPEFFPSLFGPSGGSPIDPQASLARLQDQTPPGMSGIEAAQGYVNVAVQAMANAIKRITIRRGFDPGDHVLNAFGGAGGQHACAIADALGMSQVLLHPLAGLLSAYGIGLAEARAIRQGSLELPLDRAGQAVERLIDELAFEALKELERPGIDFHRVQSRHWVRLRYEGTDRGLEVPWGPDAAAEFEKEHLRRMGFRTPGRALVVEAVVVECSAPATGSEPVAVQPAASPGEPEGTVEAWWNGRSHQVPIYLRSELAEGQRLTGPCLVREPHATTVIDPGWVGSLDHKGSLHLTREGSRNSRRFGTERNPEALEVFHGLFQAVAEQMGEVLEATATSVNIKERLDFSCAVFDAQGALIANAPHMPVHLGSMGATVRELLARGIHWHRGDAYALNDPYHGGTHLPDVTVVSPVFAGSDRPAFFVASRGHHADIGGQTPGSMPPLSRSIADEGDLIDTWIACEGELLEATILDALRTARNPAQNMADLRAQIAANARGIDEMEALAAAFGIDVVQAQMRHVLDNASELVQARLSSLRSGSAEVPMDHGSAICVSVEVDPAQGRARVDFSGTSPTSATNFNAPRSVAQAAVLYVFRLLLDADVPLNDGCLAAIDLNIPADSLLDPAAPAAVVAGNVETSQVVTDALLLALGEMAGCQGTMNNFTFGNDRLQYYETICGGAGAGANFDGADAIHTHMTNSRLTDPEVLELRYPVLLERFEIRHGSGGAGRRRGGNGVIRRIRFLEPMRAAILSGRRTTLPPGCQGGAPGLPGQTVLIRRDGTRRELAATEAFTVEAEDAVEIRTPGGGGFGNTEPAG